MKLAQAVLKEQITDMTIQTTPVVNDAPEVMVSKKIILTLKKNPLLELQE